MDKIIINAVAGSGKTTRIINSLSEEKIVIITYTTANQLAIKKEVIKKFGYVPENIYLFGLFEFLYGFCYMPLQTKHKNKGISFERPNFRNSSYHTKDGRIYSNKLSKYLLEQDINYIQRINKYFDHVFIDEMQDLASYDFEWMMSLSKLSCKTTFVGDFYQRTFDSSSNGNKGKNIKSNYSEYKKRIEKNGFIFDDKTLSSSYRCSKNVCEFINNKLNIQMTSQSQIKIDQTFVRLVMNEQEIDEIIENNEIIKLFYQKNDAYNCNSDNWGSSKGLTYKEVCVVLNKTTMNLFKQDKLHELNGRTLSKFYVACSRTKTNLYFIEESKISKYKIEKK